MIREINVDGSVVIIDTDRLYSGSENVQDDEKMVRKALGFPITKQLVYYMDKTNSNSKVAVSYYQLVEVFDEWYTVEITIEDGTKRRIHSRYLNEMQKPSFVSDIVKQMASD